MDVVDAGAIEAIPMMRDIEGRSRSITPLAERNQRSLSRSRSPLGRERYVRDRSPARHAGSRMPVEPSSTLGIFGLNPRTRERDLEDVFREFGPIQRVMVVYDRRSGHSRGFGFVYFEQLDDANRALEKTNGMMLDGRQIRVDYSATKRPHSPTPGQYMGRRSRYDEVPLRGGDYRGGGDYGGYRGRRYSRSPVRRRYPSRSPLRSYGGRREDYRAPDREYRRYSRSRSR